MATKDNDFFIEPDPITPEENFEWKMIRPKPGKKIMVTCLSTTKFGTRTYWTRSGTQPFLKSQEGDGKVRTDIRWHGYFEARLSPTGRLVIVEMTERAAQQLQKGIERFKTMRGLSIVLEREGERENSPQSLTVIRICPMPGDLPPEVPILPLLKRIWQMGTEKSSAYQPDPESSPSPDQVALINKAIAESTPDTEWMNARALDLIGQKILPLGTETPATAAAGSHHNKVNGSSRGRSRNFSRGKQHE